jgi:hypothetical protein
MSRPPDFIVGEPAAPYMHRWWVIPRNAVFNIYWHLFLRDDEDRALHDHPWPSVSIVMRGGYYEITTGPDGTFQRRWYGVGSIIFRRSTYTHRVELARDKSGNVITADTLFITGPRIREWGFHCPKGWVHWKKFCAVDQPGQIGSGCGEESP